MGRGVGGGERERDRETERQRDRETETERRISKVSDLQCLPVIDVEVSDYILHGESTDINPC